MANDFILARLNARVQPEQRGYFFEDPLTIELKAARLGKIVGGGTQMAPEPAGIQFCDIEIETRDTAHETVRAIIGLLENLGAPKGSKLLFESDREPVEFGVWEGLALYLNCTDLPPDIYRDCDVNHVIAECSILIAGEFRGHWEGSEKTALYFYGPSFESMKLAIQPFIDSYPLCQNVLVEQIA